MKNIGLPEMDRFKLEASGSIAGKGLDYFIVKDKEKGDYLVNVVLRKANHSTLREFDTLRDAKLFIKFLRELY